VTPGKGRLTRSSPLALVLAIGVLVRVALVAAVVATAEPSRLQGADHAEYTALAQALVEGRGFTLPDEGPVLRRPPGFPLLLALGIALGSPLLVPVVVHLVLWCATAHSIYRTGLLMGASTRGAALGALTFALDPLSVLTSAFVASEPLFLFLLALALEQLVRLHVAPSASATTAAWMGALVGFAAHVRTPGYFLAVPVVLWLLAVPRHGAGRWRTVLAFSAAFAATTLPWTVRNGLATGYWAFTSGADRYLYFSKAGALQAAEEGKPFREVHKARMDHLRATGGASEQLGGMRRAALRQMASSPGQTVRTTAQGVVRVLLAPPGGSTLVLFGLPGTGVGLFNELATTGSPARLPRLLRERPQVFWIDVLTGAPTVLLLACAALGAWRAPASSRAAAAGLTWVAVYFLVVSASPASHERFRAPLLPSLCVLVALARRREVPDA
jgi:hypothetical protein